MKKQEFRKNEERLRNLQDILKHSNIRIIGVPEGEGLLKTCPNDPWTKPKVGRTEDGRWGRVRRWKVETPVSEQQ